MSSEDQKNLLPSISRSDSSKTLKHETNKFEESDIKENAKINENIKMNKIFEQFLKNSKYLKENHKIIKDPALKSYLEIICSYFNAKFTEFVPYNSKKNEKQFSNNKYLQLASENYNDSFISICKKEPDFIYKTIDYQISQIENLEKYMFPKDKKEFECIIENLKVMAERIAKMYDNHEKKKKYLSQLKVEYKDLKSLKDHNELEKEIKARLYISNEILNDFMNIDKLNEDLIPILDLFLNKLPNSFEKIDISENFGLTLNNGYTLSQDDSDCDCDYIDLDDDKIKRFIVKYYKMLGYQIVKSEE